MHMHIFEGARHLSSSEWVIRAIIKIHIFNISCESDGTKVYRTTSFLDVVLVLLLGGNISNALSDEK